MKPSVITTRSDPGMQQIRQLLNSGYKQGMPAIRVTGDDIKPQAFDVYSPKILAAIMGLEDVLASRCIAIPMRRTNKKMPSFPSNFDGGAIRHQLYTLALTHFQAVTATTSSAPNCTSSTTGQANCGRRLSRWQHFLRSRAV